MNREALLWLAALEAAFFIYAFVRGAKPVELIAALLVVIIPCGLFVWEFFR